MKNRIEDLIYLNATGFKLGLLVNFGHYPRLEWERIVNTRLAEAVDAGQPPASISL